MSAARARARQGLLLVESAGDRFGVPADRVLEVFAEPEATPLPGLPGWWLAALRGRPLLLRGMGHDGVGGPQRATAGRAVVAVRSAAGRVGLLVDRVLGWAPAPGRGRRVRLAAAAQAPLAGWLAPGPAGTLATVDVDALCGPPEKRGLGGSAPRPLAGRARPAAEEAAAEDVTQVLVVRAAGQRYALPARAVLRVEPGAAPPLSALWTQGRPGAAEPAATPLAVVLASGGRRLRLGVEAVEALHRVAQRRVLPLAPPALPGRGIAGLVDLGGQGGTCPLLDVAEICAAADDSGSGPPEGAAGTEPRDTPTDSGPAVQERRLRLAVFWAGDRRLALPARQVSEAVAADLVQRSALPGAAGPVAGALAVSGAAVVAVDLGALDGRLRGEVRLWLVLTGTARLAVGAARVEGVVAVREDALRAPEAGEDAPAFVRSVWTPPGEPAVWLLEPEALLPRREEG